MIDSAFLDQKRGILIENAANMLIVHKCTDPHGTIAHNYKRVGDVPEGVMHTRFSLQVTNLLCNRWGEYVDRRDGFAAWLSR